MEKFECPECNEKAMYGIDQHPIKSRVNDTGELELIIEIGCAICRADFIITVTKFKIEKLI